MDENLELQKSFQIISCAGNSRSVSALAVRAAKDGDYDKAKEFLEEANETLTEAHKAQTDLLHFEANGNKLEATVLLIHAQDHLSMAMVEYNSALEITNLYYEIAMIKEKIGS